MSYKTEVNGVQIFGNNEIFPEWLEFIKSQGIEIDEECCYDGKITDFMGALQCLETIVMKLEKKQQDEIAELKKKEQNNKDPNRQEYFNEVLHNPNSRFYKTSLFDWRNIYTETLIAMESKDDFELSLFDQLLEIIQNSSIFLPYNFYLACKDVLQRDKMNTIEKHFFCYKIKDGESIHIRAC